MDFVEVESRAKHAGSYIHSTVKAVNSWRKHNGRLAVTGVNIKGRESTPTLVDEIAPSPGQVRTILARAPLRDRVTCALMAGFRPEVVGNYLGDDGFTLGDFPELDLSGSEPKFRKVPAPRDVAMAGRPRPLHRRIRDRHSKSPVPLRGISLVGP